MNGKHDSITTYQITVDGHLRKNWAVWLNGMTINIEYLDDGSKCTLINVQVSDQAALRGILNKLWDLNLTVIAIKRETRKFERRI